MKLARYFTLENQLSPVFIGCAGWSIPRAQTEHFAQTGSQLERFSGVLTAVEINSSFYRPHRVETYARWRASVPDGFRFSVKLPRTITHHACLKKPEALLDRFLQEVHGLGEKLGCLLVQLPPSLRFDAALADQFFTTLRGRTKTPIVCEARHETWFGESASALLASLDIAMVFADPPVVVRRLSEVRSDTVYVRLHGSPALYRSAYSSEYLDSLAADLRTHLAAGRSVWCIFDNTASGAALPNALALLEYFQAVHA